MKVNPAFPDGIFHVENTQIECQQRARTLRLHLPLLSRSMLSGPLLWMGTWPSTRVRHYPRGQWLGLVMASHGHILLSAKLSGRKFPLSQSNIFEAYKYTPKFTKLVLNIFSLWESSCHPSVDTPSPGEFIRSAESRASFSGPPNQDHLSRVRDLVFSASTPVILRRTIESMLL